jgi:uncharacterized repeat protein (TIGR01451 family)
MLYPFICFKRRSAVLFLGVALLVAGLFLSQGQKPSWAAPEQNPYSQTVPPRPPTPTPSDPKPTPDTGTSDAPDDSKNDDEVSPPAETSEQNGDIIEEETKSPGQPPLQDDGVKNDEALPPTPAIELDHTGAGSQTASSIQPVELDDEQEFPVVSQQADLSLSQRADATVANMAETLTFIIEVSNRGPNNATNIVISNSLSSELSLSEFKASHGHFNRDQGLWTIAGITAGQTVSLSLKVMVTGSGVVTNTTEIVAVDQFDPDSTPGNGLSPEDDQASVLITVSSEIEQTSQRHDNTTALTSTTAPSVEVQTWPGEVGLPFWFFGLVGGIVLMLAGLFLVRRS